MSLLRRGKPDAMLPDMDRRLDSLDQVFRPYAVEMIARLTEAGIPVTIVQTRRTEAEHAANLAAKRSWIKHSKHLDGLAIDLCPFSLYSLYGPDKLEWDSTAPVWERIGTIGEALGLTWGGRWIHRDMGHFEMPTMGAADGRRDACPRPS